jgi:hypothetical protein
VRSLDDIQAFFRAIADRLAAMQRTSRFHCGDCERNEKCGLPPDDQCVTRAMQITRDGDYRARPPADHFRPAVWPR